MEIPPEIRYVVRDGKSIAYQRFGSGDRRLVMITTSAGNLDLWWTDAAISDVLVRAAERSSALMYDQLGLGPVGSGRPCPDDRGARGRSGRGDGRRRVRQRATILATYDASLGAVLFAAQHPERVDALAVGGAVRAGLASAPVEELVGWEDAEQVEAYERGGAPRL